MYCQRCGTEIDASAHFCKNCGAPTGVQPYPYPYPQPQPAGGTNFLALLGLILAFVMPAAGIVVSVIARRQCKDRGEDGVRLATAGIILGSVITGLAIVVLAAAIVIPILAAPMFGTAFGEAFAGMFR